MESKNTEKNLLTKTLIVSLIIVGGTLLYLSGPKSATTGGGDLEAAVLPQEGIVLPIKWGDLGLKMAEAGVIDPDKFESIYGTRGGMPEEAKKMLSENNSGSIRMTPQNANVILNMFWAFGLGNKNPILEQGPMMSYRDTGNFASTGGWTLAKGDAMDHYSRHSFIQLTNDQQQLVERVSQNIYRPCCNNPTYFPDCNHGMAMLGLLELMAAGNVSEGEIYKVALQVNSYWFPDTYLTIAKYFSDKGVKWTRVSPQEVLGADYSSATGYEKVLTAVGPVDLGQGGGCGV